jgi:glycosyltransferase involved in cell wall biosynthesis
MFVHTQVPAVLLTDVMRRVPTIVSVDATPLQYDELGRHYGHHAGSRRVEDVKRRMNTHCFRAAHHVVTWSDWTKQDLVRRYEVPPQKITVIPPGVNLARWSPPGEHPRPDDAPIAFLFVGGDFERKGGRDLLGAFRALRAERQDIELHVVTSAAVDAEPGVQVHRGLTPNDPALIALYHRADVFCLPTLGDCLPMVLSEAGACGLPLVSTDVGAIHEIVVDDVTGLLVPPSDGAALLVALRHLAADASLRERLGAAAHAHVSARYRAESNVEQLVELLVDTASATGGT